MGCASSKQARRDRTPVTPLPRSHSLPTSVPVHHPAHKKGDPYHIVALTSSTLENLALDSSDPKPEPPNSLCKKDETEEDGKQNEPITPTKSDETHRDRLMDWRPSRLHLEFSKEVSAAKTWSSMMEERISKMPKTPTETPPGEPETINAWEMMEGLEDTSPIRCFSFHAFSNTKISETGNSLDEPDSPKPLWIQTPAPDAIIAEFDPEIISNFRKALEQLSPHNTCQLRSPEGEKMGSVQDRIRAFQDRIDERRVKKGQAQLPPPPTPPLNWSSPAQSQWPPRGKARVVIYFTSLRGVRKTYEDCCRVRLILKGLGVRVDERDVSMHQGFREELLELLGPVYGGLPRVFVNGTYVGGAEEVRRMHDTGELDKLSEGCEKVEECSSVACEGCGDVRFVPCEICSGSCKVFVEEDEDGFPQEGFVRCLGCNENGLVQCPLCFS